MKKRWALLLVLVALPAGAAAAVLFARPAQAPLRITLSCMLLHESEKAGYLDSGKRSALIERLGSSGSLDPADLYYVRLLSSECSKL